MKALIAGIGNIFFGDDGFGPEVLRQLAGLQLGNGVRVRDFGISGFHLALEMLEPYELIVLVDAIGRDAPPGTVFVVEADAPRLAYARRRSAEPRGPEPVLSAVEAIPQDDMALPQDDNITPDAHSMDVTSVLSLYAQLRSNQNLPSNQEALDAKEPRILIVGCVPQTIDEGIQLSKPVQAAIPSCIALISQLLEQHVLNSRTIQRPNAMQPTVTAPAGTPSEAVTAAGAPL